MRRRFILSATADAGGIIFVLNAVDIMCLC